MLLDIIGPVIVGPSSSHGRYGEAGKSLQVAFEWKAGRCQISSPPLPPTEATERTGLWLEECLA